MELKDFIELEEAPIGGSPSIMMPNPNAEVGNFNMMFQTKVGASEDSSAVSYLRPETAQGIFVNFFESIFIPWIRSIRLFSSNVISARAFSDLMIHISLLGMMVMVSPS